MRALYSPEVYGSGKGVQEIAVWNLDGVDDPGGLPVWLMVLSAAIPVGLIAGLVFKETKMAAKRKRRSLSGSPEQHAKRAVAEEQGALSNFKDVISASKSKNCGLAFTMWTLGAEHAARAESNASDASPGATMSRKVMDAYNNAGDQFRIHCLAKGGLSGLRRKARKARR